jgi:hypothetical protein
VLLTLNLPLLLSDNLMTPSSVNSLSSTAFQLLSFVSQAGIELFIRHLQQAIYF